MDASDSGRLSATITGDRRRYRCSMQISAMDRLTITSLFTSNAPTLLHFFARRAFSWFSLGINDFTLYVEQTGGILGIRCLAF